MPMIRRQPRTGALLLFLPLGLGLLAGCAHFRDAHDRAEQDPPVPMRAALAAAPVPDTRPPSAVAEARPSPAQDGEQEITVTARPEDGKAVIVMATVPPKDCAACDTTKMSVAIAGKVLIERGHWSGGQWHYKRQITRVRPERASAFAKGLSRLRPLGTRDLAGVGDCSQGGGRGVVVDWLSAERQDRLTIDLDCLAQSNPALYQKVLKAPDALGLRQVALWDAGK
jgi:hypothetical protein